MEKAKFIIKRDMSVVVFDYKMSHALFSSWLPYSGGFVLFHTPISSLKHKHAPLLITTYGNSEVIGIPPSEDDHRLVEHHLICNPYIERGVQDTEQLFKRTNNKTMVVVKKRRKRDI